MITCKLTGRLGNITLEIFNLFWYAHICNIPFQHIVLNRGYKASCCNYNTFKKHQSFQLEDYISSNEEYFKNIINHFLPSQIYDNMTNGYIEQEFQPIIDSKKKLDNVIFVSNPANTRYLNQSKEAGLKLFKALFYRKQLRDENLKRVKDIESRIAIHIRRTDYAAWRKGTNMLSAELILKAIEIYAKTGFKKFAVFSDDIEWCKKNLNCQYDMLFVDQDEHDYNDMYLMSCCKDIFQNGGHSSFSGCAKILHKCN